ncbi:hypothetical protein [Algiphilus sp.]|uniref:hypothetical protein n=1 Tax=Algiphilus sp. TaxID=1872431 RepID=UPI003CCBE45E
MSEVKIRFLADYQVKAAGGERYKADQVKSLPEASARHFISRGVAEMAKTEPAAKKAAAKKVEGKD